MSTDAPESESREPRRPIVDHPAVTGALATILTGRNVAVGLGRDGRVLLARPDSAVVEMPRDDARRTALSALVERRGFKLPDEALRPGKGSPRVVPVSFGPEEPTAVGGGRRASIGRAAEFVTASRAAGLLVDYNHVFLGAQTVRGNPLGAPTAWAGEMAFMGDVYEGAVGQAMLSTAEPALEPVFRRRPIATGGRPPRILVLDTGLSTTVPGDEARAAAGTREARHPWLKAACRVHDHWTSVRQPGVIDDEDETFDPPLPLLGATAGDGEASGDRLLDFEAGHGTFIAGVIEQICPDAEIHSAGVLSSFGDGDVVGVLATLGAMVDPAAPFDIVVMSFGTNLEDDEPGVFGRELMRLLGPALGVAAAGNQATCRPYFPAALPGVIGVGALAADGKAWFSNFGGWVDACAPGIDVVSTFFDDFDEVLHDTVTRRFRQWARWSGTSFSAPKVAAAIAREMYLFGGTAQEAWKRLATPSHYRYPDLGVVFNV